MNVTQTDLRKRLLYILHLGFVEARLLALGQKYQQIFDLADAMELLPRYVDECTDENLESIRFVLKNYQEKYPESRFDYLARLEQYDPPERY
jgi:hypothetical protein